MIALSMTRRHVERYTKKSMTTDDRRRGKKDRRDAGDLQCTSNRFIFSARGRTEGPEPVHTLAIDTDY